VNFKPVILKHIWIYLFYFNYFLKALSVYEKNHNYFRLKWIKRNEKWMCLSSFLADVFDKVNELNLSLQNKNTNI